MCLCLSLARLHPEIYSMIVICKETRATDSRCSNIVCSQFTCCMSRATSFSQAQLSKYLPSDHNTFFFASFFFLFIFLRSVCISAIVITIWKRQRFNCSRRRNRKKTSKDGEKKKERKRKNLLSVNSFIVKLLLLYPFAATFFLFLLRFRL